MKRKGLGLWLTGVFLAATVLSQAAYLPQGDSRSGGMDNQVLLYTLNPPGGNIRSRMPWVSGDGNSLYFGAKGYGIEEIWYSTKSAGVWQGAVPLVDLNSTGYSSMSPCLSPDGNQIYFTSTRPVGSPYNLTGGRWRIFTATRKVSGGWNTPYYLNVDAVSGTNVTVQNDGHDFGVSISRDGKTLYFNSSRSGGYGGYDIWYSKKSSNGQWTAAVNAGATINTASSEQSGVCVSNDEKTMIFSSNQVAKRIYGTDTWNFYKAIRSSTTALWSTASVTQVGGISPVVSGSTSWGVSWPCISSDDSTLYYSDGGTFYWFGDAYDIFFSNYTNGNWTAGKNIGRAINNLIWCETEDFLPYVAYVNATTGKPTDWMFDSYLFLALSGASTQNRYDVGPCYKDDWVSYLDSIFYPARQLHKLDEVVDSVKTTLNQPGYKVKMSVMIPKPVSSVTNFGDVDGDGISENLSTVANRVKVCQWYINDFYSRWTAANFQNIELTSLYWLDEYLGSETTVVKQVATAVHNKGLKFEWIPYYSSDYYRWSSAGFDFTELQPNYAWLSQSDPSRFASNASRAKSYTMGIELEMDYRPLTDGMNLRAYLDNGTNSMQGYMYNCLIGCYQDVAAIKNFCYATTPYGRDAYDGIYQFLKEKYPTPVSVGKSYSYSTAPNSSYPDTSFSKLTDYYYLPDSTYMSRVVGFANVNPSITFDLASVCQVEKVYGHFGCVTSWGVYYPSQMKVEVSNNNSTWTTVGTTSVHPSPGTDLTQGDMLVKFTPTTGRYVKVTLTNGGTWIWVDEMQVYGTYNFTEIDDWRLF
jgi:hypothetical protein